MDSIKGANNNPLIYKTTWDSDQSADSTMFNLSKDSVKIGSGEKSPFISFSDIMAKMEKGKSKIQSGEKVAPHSKIAREEKLKAQVEAPIPPFRFAEKYSIEDIMNNPGKASAFEKQYLLQESGFFALARHPKSGLTYDGIALDPKTGKPTDLRNWSAPSKECLDMAILIKALEGDPKSSLVVAQGNPEKAKQIAADILDRKMDSYMEFYRENPQYGGFLPWFESGKKIIPMGEWKEMVPGLDNGEWAWTLLVAEKSLRDQGYVKIADKYAKYIDLLRENVVKMFYDEKEGKVRGNVSVKDPGAYSSTGYITGEHGVHEGQMMVLFVTLFGKDLPQDAPSRIWKDINMKRVEHKHGTTWQGYWGSSHESWAYLFLPYRDIQGYKDLFRIREIIRSQNAAERGYPGLGASTNEPGGTGYLSDCGIEGIGSQPVNNNHVFAIYGAFPMLLECADPTEKQGNYGLAWLLNMLKAPKMQSPIGGGESGTNDGKAICPIKTIDGSFPNIIALMGGLEKETRDMLKQYGKYEQFISIMKDKYNEAFGAEPLREPSGFALPTVSVPKDNLPEYVVEESKK